MIGFMSSHRPPPSPHYSLISRFVDLFHTRYLLEDLDRALMAALALICVAAALVWWRSASRLAQALKRLKAAGTSRRVSADSLRLARDTYAKDLHAFWVYVALAGAGAVAAGLGRLAISLPFCLVALPAVVSLFFGSRFVNAARLAERRSLLEQRAEEVLEQEELAPMRWAARLAPAELPQIEGFEVGHAYQAGSGAMAGDFYDLTMTAPSRLAAVIGDVTGHGIDSSITAFQVKYLFRVLLLQYRDPAQAMEELNKVLSAQGRPEELVSICAVLFDQLAGTLRYASAGHPAAWVWHDGDVAALRATGPLLSLDPKATYFSREYPIDEGDVVLLCTDGLTEARAGEALFGEERVAQFLRRESGAELEALCKDLLSAAQDFATEPLSDDVAILAIRRR